MAKQSFVFLPLISSSHALLTLYSAKRQRRPSRCYSLSLYSVSSIAYYVHIYPTQSVFFLFFGAVTMTDRSSANGMIKIRSTPSVKMWNYSRPGQQQRALARFRLVIARYLREYAPPDDKIMVVRPRFVRLDKDDLMYVQELDSVEVKCWDIVNVYVDKIGGFLECYRLQ